MKAIVINCYYCDYYNDECNECELGYLNEDDCIKDESEEEND